MKYADDTVIYYSHKDIKEVEKVLNNDFASLTSWLEQNELVVNKKKDKTEVMIFGTSKRLNKLDDQQLQIKHHQSTINNTSTYRYLGLTLNKTLNMSEHVQKTIKKASSRINLLKKMRCHLDSKTASLIYNTMIVPILTNSALATYGTTSASLDSKIYALERRARKVVGILASIPSSKQIKMKRVVAFVHRCINGKTIKNFENSFEVLESKINTRNNGKMT